MCGVVQAGGGLGLELEPLQLLGVQRRGEGQDLQRHPAAERDLLGLVDDAHAAPADLAEDAGSRRARPSSAMGPAAASAAPGVTAADRPAQVGHHLHGREQPAELARRARGARRATSSRSTGSPAWSRSVSSSTRSARTGSAALVAGRRSADRLMRSSSRRSSSSRPRSRVQGAGVPGLDGPLGDPQHGGDLGGRQLLQVAQDQDLAVARGQPIQARPGRRSRSSSRIRRRLGLVPLATRRSARAIGRLVGQGQGPRLPRARRSAAGR